MTPERFREVEQLYHAARDCGEAERRMLLDRADADLRREVESLLAHDGLDGPMERPVSSVAKQVLDDSTVTQLTSGTRLGPYQIEAPLGAGGMGEVYKARDSRLGRAVAIKISREQFNSRFEREARAISALNHPHICTLYDIGPNYLVMELVEGETLQACLRKGALPIERVLRYGAQIADALASAHARGIVHRDLKPGNIMITDAGIKVLDFGLAKVVGHSEASTERSLTGTGMIVGTPAYMAPEQLEGRECDARTDIFALGLVLYETATGNKAFAGENRAGLIAQLLECKLPPLEGLPPQVVRVVRRCLAKDPGRRWQSALDVKLELEESLPEPEAISAPLEVRPLPMVSARSSARRETTLRFAAGALAIVAAALGVGLWRATRPSDRPLVRLSVDLGPDAVAGLGGSVAISPDGARLVFPARGIAGNPQLATRLLAQPQATLLAGTEGGRDPFFSPDGKWVGFFAGGQMKKVSLEGGAAVTVCAALSESGASWGDDGNIIVALGPTSALSRVPATGGVPQPFTKLASGELSHSWPHVLPGAEAVLFTVLATPAPLGLEAARIEVLSIKTGHKNTLVRGGHYGRYLPSGHLVYVHQGVLFGAAFDPVRLEMRGTPAPLLEDMAGDASRGSGEFDFSRAALGPGIFMYLAGKGTSQRWLIVSQDSSGKTQTIVATPGRYAYPRFSPDGKRLAMMAVTGSSSSILVYDLERDALTRLPFSGQAYYPAWAPDGKHIVFQGNAGNASAIWWTRADGAGEAQTLLTSPDTITPYSFPLDGRRLAYFGIYPETAQDLWTLPLDLSDPDHPKPGKPEVFLRTPSNELLPAFSPDGHWIAYRSNESGETEIYVRPFPGPGGKWQISTRGGLYAVWSPNGRELFYETPENRIMVVSYTAQEGSFFPGKPRVWSEKPIFYAGTSNLDLAPDGKRFAVLSIPEALSTEKEPPHIMFLLNFFDELRRRIPNAR